MSKVSFYNNWIAYVYFVGYGQRRTYGGNRSHEGIDIMSNTGAKRDLEVIAAAQGLVEKMGWLPLGGYRIGIRSKSGLYYYYAHLDSYRAGLHVGDYVEAGDVLGIMGDTGYGKEGTRGKFPIHLHFGIYYSSKNGEESMNPYGILRYVDRIT